MVIQDLLFILNITYANKLAESVLVLVSITSWCPCRGQNSILTSSLSQALYGNVSKRYFHEMKIRTVSFFTLKRTLKK